MLIDVNLGPLPLDKVGEKARSAEEMGFDCIWFPEMNRTPFMACAIAAEHTNKVNIGTEIALAFPRSPTVTAYTSWELQSYSEGRFILGLGSQVKGHIERRFGVKWESPGPKLREYIKTLRAIWRTWQEGEDLDFDGKFYSLDLMPPAFSPGAIEYPEIPIYISAVNEYNLKTAGKLCDGVHIHPLHSIKYISDVVIPKIREGAKEEGRSINDIKLSTSVFTVTGRNDQEMESHREFVRSQMAFYGSTRTYRRVFEIHGWGEVCDELHELSVNGRWDEMPDLITDEILAAFSVEAPLNKLRNVIEKKYAKLDRVSLYHYFWGEDMWREFLRK